MKRIRGVDAQDLASISNVFVILFLGIQVNEVWWPLTSKVFLNNCNCIYAG